MVKIQDHISAERPGDLAFDAWFSRLPVAFDTADQTRLFKAWELAQSVYGQTTRELGDRCIDHALHVAEILADLRLDADSLIAALLHDSPESVAQQAGDTVASLIDGCSRMRQVSHLHGAGSHGRAGERAEALRKMLLAMAKDIRVVFLVLAERLHDMRCLRALDDAQQVALAAETLDLYAPLANRLGIWQIKWELEDLSFRCLEPTAYKRIASLLAEKRTDRERFIHAMQTRLEQALAAANIKAEVTGRPKHLFSIWRKMQRKGLDFHQLFDLRAFRILVDDVAQCYAALGVVHSQWPPIAREFDDYIAAPKENQYRSLHTAVVGEGGRPVEVQIRTYEMHQQAELGIAAHWRYKEGKSADPAFDARVAWLRTLLDSAPGAEGDGDDDFIDRFKAEVFEDRVYVMTPKGDVIDLPRGATALDFAYAVHSEVGHRCRGAKINGQIAPLSRPLGNGDYVEVLTARNARPSRDWLNPSLGYLRTPRALARVRSWFRQQDYEQNVSDGRSLLERELHRLGVEDVNLDALAGRSAQGNLSDFLAAIGRGDVTGGQIASLLSDRLLPDRDSTAHLVRPRRADTKSGTIADGDIRIYGVGNLLTRLARCCQPTPGDSIIGFITRGEGISIHRRDCANVRRLEEVSPERLIEVSWSGAGQQQYPVDILVEAHDRRGLIRDISLLLNNEGINVTAVNTRTDPDQEVAFMTLTIEVSDADQLSRVIDRIAGLRNVREVRRAG
ncbi:MAG: bifunctional (p)ppGpp synthetase/guanosine-3',5'-bis(diphosphate) 3'-pyrophosphohydrolase [Gammaproteobacteria bacterium]|nr:bifunctional (p)ppGpp synthetase/guanosine-3',5'-bis(diphosphate) 3'-pyrophosphohydrolase [Gammaproteobacteria bacterium]